MQVPVLIELLPSKGFRAKAGAPFNCEAEGKTRDEVLQTIRGMIEGRLNAVTEVVQLDIAIPENPLLQMVGTLDLEDPLVQEWIQTMEENRRKADEDPDYP